MIIGIFSHFFALETTLAERQFFRALAKLIGRRAARLSACGIAAIVSKMGYLEEGCAVGADGSLYNVRRRPRTRKSGKNLTSMFCSPLLSRNTPGLRNACTRASTISLARRESGCWLLPGAYFGRHD